MAGSLIAQPKPDRCFTIMTFGKLFAGTFTDTHEFLTLLIAWNDCLTQQT